MISRIIVGVFLDILRPFFRSDFRLNLRQLMVAVFFLAIVLNAFPMYAKSKSYDEIFKQVFGRIPEKQYFRQQMALVVDYQFVGDDLVVLVPSVGTDYKLYSYTLLKYLYDNQKPGTLREFTQKIDDDGMVAVDQLESMGYRITVDRRAFRVSIDIPPEFRKKIIYYVMGGPDDDIVSTQKTTVKPANLSAYLNYSFSTNYIASELDDSENGLEAPRGAFLGLVKSGQYGLNYAGSVDMSNDEVVNMSVLNLERDFGLKNKRYLLGQISPMTKGSQATLSLLGVGITQGPILNSIGNFSPRFSHELILDVDSQVDIYINYQKVKSVNLPGGIYELKGFPLRTGFNVIKIVKTSVYDIVPSTKDDLVTDGVYNDINEGVLYKTKANQNESFLDQSLRLHNARIVSSEWLASDKVPRKGVQIEDDSPPVKKKVVTEFVYPFALDPVLYAPKYNELSYGIGFPATWSGLNLATSDQVTQSLYYKKGLNNFITSTVYTQVNNQHLLLGNELYIASPFGPISVNNALKQTQGIDKLGAFSRFSFLTYPIASDPNAPFRLLTIGFSGSLRASRFIPFGVARPVPYDNFLSQFSMGFSYQIRDLFSGTIQWSQTKALNGNSEGDVRQFSSVIQRRLPFNFNLSAAYQTNEGKLVVEPHLFTFKVGWSGFDGVNASSMYKETVGTKDVQVDATIQKTFLDGALTTSTYLQNSSEKKSLSTSLKYGRHNANFSFVETPLQTDQQLNYILTNQRFNSNIGVLHREVQGAPVNIFSLSAESAFVYADNYFAISTPIQDSFAVFASDYTLKGEPVFVGEEGRNINFLGPTVLPSLRDRVLTDIMVDIPNLPVGAEYQRLHSFQPVNVQGYLVELHVTPSVLLMGKLVNQKGRPYKYQRGYLVSKVTQKKQRFITSRSGIFQVPNLIPGTYQITFSKNRYTSVDITVPDNADGLFRLNNLVIQRNLDVELDSDNESELQQQLNEKQTQRQDEQLDDRSSEALLQQLIADILSEPILEIESVAPTQSLTKKETPVNDTPEMPAALINDPNLSSIENAQKLHALKGEINQLLLKAKSAPSEKDTLEIAQKINEFYLQLIQPDRSKLIQNINEITNTDQKAKAEHEKRKTREAFPSQRVRSDAIDEAQRQHLKRAKD